MEKVANAARAHFGDQKLDLHDFLEAQRLEEIAGGAHPRPADVDPIEIAVNTEPERAKKGVLGIFHYPVKIREMHDARKIGLRELDAVAVDKFVGHLERY